MIWKVLILILRCEKTPYIRAIKTRENTYIVQIDKYLSADGMIRKMKCAPGVNNPEAH